MSFFQEDLTALPNRLIESVYIRLRCWTYNVSAYRKLDSSIPRSPQEPLLAGKHPRPGERYDHQHFIFFETLFGKCMTGMFAHALFKVASR